FSSRRRHTRFSRDWSSDVCSSDLTLKRLDGCDQIHISFDVDVLDPSVSRGTGTPVPNGLTAREAATLIVRLMQSNKIGSFEVVEVNTTLDRENLMAEQAFDILLRASNQLTHNI